MLILLLNKLFDNIGSEKVRPSLLRSSSVKKFIFSINVDKNIIQGSSYVIIISSFLKMLMIHRYNFFSTYKNLKFKL